MRSDSHPFARTCHRIEIQPDPFWRFFTTFDAQVEVDAANHWIQDSGASPITEKDIHSAGFKIVGRCYVSAPYENLPGLLGVARFEIKHLSRVVKLDGQQLATIVTHGTLSIPVLAPALFITPSGEVKCHPVTELTGKWTFNAPEHGTARSD